MKHFKWIIFKILNEQCYIRNILILLILTRLLFLEDNQLALIAEIVGGLVVIFTTPESELESD